MSIRTVAVALAVGLGFMVSGGVAAAVPVGTDGSQLDAQCTRQYVVTTNATLRNSPGGSVITNAIPGDKFNVPSPSGNWYEGNLYDAASNYIGHGFILASALNYTGICF